MSHWLNHDPFAIDRTARRHADRQAITNLAGVGLLGAANYILGRTTYRAFSSQNSGMPAVSRKRSLSVYASGSGSGRPAKRRSIASKRKAATSSKKTVFKRSGKNARRTKRGGRRPRRNIKRSRKRNGNPWGVFQKLGVLRTHETGVSTTGVTDAGFVGHASFRPTGLMTDFILVLLKAAFATAGIHMNNTNETVPVPVGDAIEIYVKKNSGDATTLSSTGYVFLGGESWIATAGYIITSIVSAVGAQDISSSSLVGINLSHAAAGGVPAHPYARLNLIGAKIIVKSESWLKIQNQTVTALGSEEDEVDRCPILVNKYWGNGTGAYSNRLFSTEAQLVQNQSSGIITKVGTVVSGMSEAPPKSYFTGCKGKQQFVLAPGHFAQSKAFFNSTVAIEKFWPMITSQYTSSSGNNYYPNGSWNLFHFEHLIKPKAASASLVVNGEVNFRTGCYVTMKKYHNTDERVESATYVTY